MPSLSVIMIVKNEAHRLGRCLESVKDVAEEILVADTGSTDGTIELARGLGARVITIPWRNDFAEARNRTIAAASGDWLLHLDADEVLDPDGARRIRDLVDQDGVGADAIEVTLANYCDDPRAWRWVPIPAGSRYAGGFSGYIETTLLRLFRNRRGFEYREPVHENITESVLERGGRIRREGIVIHHYGYDPQDSRTGVKAAFYLAIARAKREAHPDDPKALHDFAEQALACNLPEEAEDACRRVLVIDPLHLNAGTTLANILLNRGDLAEARGILERLAEHGIRAPHVLTALGAIACREGRIEEARAYLEQALAAAPRTVMARLYLARVSDRQGRADEARRALECALELAPTIPEFGNRVRAHALRLEGERRLQAGCPAEALKCFVEALRLDVEDPITHNALGVVLHALGDIARARESFHRALALAPGWDDAEANLRALNPEAGSNTAR